MPLRRGCRTPHAAGSVHCVPRVEGERDGETERLRTHHQITGQINGRAEFRAEVIGRPIHGQFEAHGDFHALGRHQFAKFFQLGAAVDGVGFHACFHSVFDLGARTHGVVVVHGGVWRDAGNCVDFDGRGHVKPRRSPAFTRFWSTASSGLALTA